MLSLVNLIVRMVKCSKSGCDDDKVLKIWLLGWQSVVNLVVKMGKFSEYGCEDGKVD